MNNYIKIRRIQALIGRLENGQQVTPRDLRSLLTKDDLNEINLAWKEEKIGREAEKPIPIKKYEKLLQIACSYYGLMEKYSGSLSKNEYLARAYSHKSDIAFERAIEFIREAEDKNSDISLWLDRDVFGEIEYNPISIPRVIGSRNHECQDKRKTPYPLQTKREVKIQVLEEIVKRMTSEYLKDSLEPFMIELETPKFDRKKPPPEFTGFIF